MDDLIVEEIHRVREKLLEECGGDLERLMDLLKAQEEQDGSRLVVTARPSKSERPGGAQE